MPPRGSRGLRVEGLYRRKRIPDRPAADEIMLPLSQLERRKLPVNRTAGSRMPSEESPRFSKIQHQLTRRLAPLKNKDAPDVQMKRKLVGLS